MSFFESGPVVFLLCLAIALIGATAHWYKRYVRQQTKAGFAEYLFGEPQHTLYSLCSLVGAVAALMAVGKIDVGSVNTFGELLMAGYTIDSMVNKAPDDT